MSEPKKYDKVLSDQEIRDLERIEFDLESLLKKINFRLVIMPKSKKRRLLNDIKIRLEGAQGRVYDALLDKEYII